MSKLQPPNAVDGSKDHANVVVLPPILYLGSVLAGVVTKWAFGGSVAPDSTLRWLAGLLLLVFSVAVSLRFARLFSETGQDKNPNTPTPSLVTHGLYSFSRNPAYVGLTGIQLALALLLDNVWILVLLVPTLLVMHTGVIWREESYLERKFGDEYRRYKNTVRRWL